MLFTEADMQKSSPEIQDITHDAYVDLSEMHPEVAPIEICSLLYCDFFEAGLYDTGHKFIGLLNGIQTGREEVDFKELINV